MALLYGNRLDNLLTGGFGNDTLAGLGGNDTIDGGGSPVWSIDRDYVDTAWYSGVLAGYRFSADAQGRLVVTDANAADGSDGIDTLSRIERLTFGNAALSLGQAEFRVNTTRPGNQYQPSVAALPDGGFVVAWANQTLDGGGNPFNGFVQRFDAAGFAVGPEARVFGAVDFQIVTETDVAVFGDGSTVVAITAADSGTSPDFGILLRIFGPSGEAVRSMDATGVSSGVDFQTPALAPLGTDRFLLAYHESDTSGFGSWVIRASSIGIDGSSFNIGMLSVDGSNSSPDAAGIAGVGTVVAWSGLDADGTGIFAQRFDADGALAGSRFAVNTVTANNQEIPSVAMLEDGRFVVAWVSADGVGAGDIAARVFNANGTPAGGQFFVDGETFGLVQSAPSVASLADGGFVVSWVADTGSNSTLNVAARRFDSAGAPVGEAFRVNNVLTAQTQPALAGLAGGGFVVTWEDGSDLATNGVDVMASVFDGNGGRDPFITGTAAADVISLGGAHTVMVDGGSGNDSVTGGAAIDFLQGGAGNDTLVGGESGDNLLGGAGIDVLDGGAGADVLDGGEGADRMTGGAGDDEYVVDSAGDVITELPSGGNDTVRSAITLTLLPTLENLVLTGRANINATGNAGGNLLVGNDGNNRLDGGAGADLMSGGAGSDTYVVDNELDGVGEAEGGGIDTVISSVTVRLSENVEFLTLTGTANLTGIGNAADNSISGNGGANILVGEEGNDTIAGGGGNDTLDGLQGNDVLNGGAGNDLLNGRDGSDVFIFDTPLSAALNVDTLDDFDPSQDRIDLSKSVFTGLGATSQALQAGEFSSGAGINAASAPSHRIIYNTTTGDLYYDRDGSALAAAPVKFAVINGSPDTLDNTDFFVTT